MSSHPNEAWACPRCRGKVVVDKNVWEFVLSSLAEVAKPPYGGSNIHSLYKSNQETAIEALRRAGYHEEASDPQR